MINIIRIILGVILLLAGQRLFWLFVGIIGFVIGLGLSTEYLQGESEVVLLIISLLAGILGALLAHFLPRFAIELAGFVAGGYVLTKIFLIFGWNSGPVIWLPFLIGGILGAVLVGVLYDWALIILSSLVGANLISQTVLHEAWMASLAFIILFILGILVQIRSLRWQRSGRR